MSMALGCHIQNKNNHMLINTYHFPCVLSPISKKSNGNSCETKAGNKKKVVVFLEDSYYFLIKSSLCLKLF